MRVNFLLGLVVVGLTHGSVLRVKRGITTGYSVQSSGYGGGGGGGGYTGGSPSTHVLLAGGGGGYGQSSGAASHVLNLGSGPVLKYYGGSQDQYTHAAIYAGDPYAAKAIGQGQFDITQANAAASSAAQGIYATANDPGLAAEVAYATNHANQAALNAASHYGAAAVYTGTARAH